MKRRGTAGSKSPLVPERIGRYDVLLPIASGGMGTVYLSRSSGLGGFQREVALKVMHAHLREEEHFATDLIEEAKLAVRIHHPNVVQVLDVGEDPHGVFLVMEYIEGDSLAGLQRAARKRDVAFPTRIGMRILADALNGLHAAHELTDDDGEPLGLVHRDFSPQNILVGVDGTSKLTDFGVAKAKTRLSHTATGLVKGKIHYMSPEQARTEEIDRRCDIWAGGVMTWETLAGRRLYTERGDASILLKLITEPPPRLRTVRREVPQALEDVVSHALATDVKKRCPSAKQFASSLLQAAMDHGGVASADEVAAFVADMSGENLRKRRIQVGEVLKLRDEIKLIARQSTVDAHELETSPAEGLGTPSSEGMPRTSIDTEIELEEATTLAPTGYEEETQVTHSAQTLVAAPQSKRTMQVLVAAALVGVAGATLYAFTGSSPAIESTPTEESPAVVAPPPTTPPTPSAAPRPKPSTSADSTHSIDVTANAAIVQVRVGARVIPVSPASTRVSLELTAAERKVEQTIMVRAPDGRVARTTLAPQDALVTLEFAPRAVRVVPRVRPTAAPLATNPHQ